MGWSKVAAIFFILVVFFVVGFFGAHFGYQTDADVIRLQNLPQIVSVEQHSDIYIATFDTGFKQVMTWDELQNYINAGNPKPNHNVAGYLMDLAQFNIAGTPGWVSTIFDIFVIILIYLVITSFTPFIGGG